MRGWQLSDQVRLRQAYDWADKHSDDRRTKVGALLVSRGLIARAANQLPPGVKKNRVRVAHDTKRPFMEHAERGVIYAAASVGLPTKGATLYAPWFACEDCARAIICAGITKVIGHQQVWDKTPERWKSVINVGLEMMMEAGIELDYYDGPIGGCKNLFDGEWWTP